MLANITEIINSLDFLNFFGYVPKFTIQKKGCYKSKLGAIVFLCYFVIFWYYVITVTIDFINKYNEVDKIKILTVDSPNYIISTNDLYFGFAMKSVSSQSEILLNISDYPGLVFGLQFVNIDSYGKKNYTEIKFTTCDISLFFSTEDWNNTTSDRQKVLKNTISYYLCPDPSGFNQTLIPYGYLQNYSFYQFYVKANNDSVLNSTLKLLSMNKPRIQFIWSAISIDSKEKDNPYGTYINSFQSTFHSTEFEEIDIFINANSIFDDDYRFSSGYNVYKNHEYSLQANGEVFTFSQIVYHTINLFSRTIPPGSNDTDHLYFHKIKINLSKEIIKIYRDYIKIVDFLAATTALTSIILFFLMIIIDCFHSILSKHFLIKTLFSSNSIKHMQEFENDYKSILVTDDKRSKKQNSQSSKEEIFKINSFNNIDSEKDIFEFNKITSGKEEKILYKSDPNIVFMNRLYNNKTLKFFVEDKEINFDFKFHSSLRSLFCKKDRNNEIYNFSSERLDVFMGIETLISKYNEVEMIKEFLFDNPQIKIFETLSRLVAVQRFFSEIKEENLNIFEGINDKSDEKIKQILKEVSHLKKRGLKRDKKLLLFFRALFNLHEK